MWTYCLIKEPALVPGDCRERFEAVVRFYAIHWWEKYVTKEPKATNAFQKTQAKFIEIMNLARSAQYFLTVFVEQRQTEVAQNKKYII